MKNTFKLFSPVGLVLLYIVCIFSPYIMFYELYIPLIIGLVFLLVSIFKLFKIGEKLVYSLSVFLVIGLVYRLIGVSTASIGNYIEQFLWFISVWMAFYLWRYGNEKDRKITAVFTSIIFVANLIYTAVIRGVYNDFSSFYETYVESLEFYSRLNIGTTYVTMAALFYTIFIVSYTKIRKIDSDRNGRLIFILLSIFLIYFVVFWGDSTTTSITLLFSLLFILFVKNGNVIKPIIAFVSIYIIFSINVQQIADFCREYINDRLADRLLALKHMATGSTSSEEDDILSRFPMIWQDIEMWFDSANTMLFGNGRHSISTGDIARDVIVNKAGGHSTIFDTLSRYGIVGLILSINLILNLRDWIEKNVNYKSIAHNIFWVLIISNILNVTLYPNVLFIVFFFTPFLKRAQLIEM